MAVLSSTIVPVKLGGFLVIAHRGSSGERPEHTRAAYILAAQQDADFIELDLVMTKDGVLIARHEGALAVLDPTTGKVTEATTDVADRPQFDNRRTTKTIDGNELTGWFAEDFTLQELKTLRTRERLRSLRPQNTRFDDQEPILTFAEVLNLAEELEETRGRPLGVYVELKHPGYFRSSALPMEPAVLDDLAGFNGPAVIQSFEPSCLRRLRSMTRRPLTQLIAADGVPADNTFESYVAMTTPVCLTEVAEYADAIAVSTPLVLPTPTAPTPLVKHARGAGLSVHVWTLRAENHFLPESLRSGKDPAAHGDLAAEAAALREAGVDGIITDFPGFPGLRE